MLSEELGFVEELLKGITESKEEKGNEKEITLDLIDKDEELGKIDLERELNSTGKKKKDFYKEVIELINKTIEGNATVDEVVEFVKKRKNAKKLKSFIKF